MKIYISFDASLFCQCVDWEATISQSSLASQIVYVYDAALKKIKHLSQKQAFLK